MPTADQVFPAVDTAAADRRLSSATPEERVRWAVEQFGSSLVMSTSFGAQSAAGDAAGGAGDEVGSPLGMSPAFGPQSAAMLHLVTRTPPDIPVVIVDTG